jgi:hypothetical protein
MSTGPNAAAVPEQPADVPERPAAGRFQLLHHPAVGSVVRVAAVSLALSLIYSLAPLGQRLHGRVIVGLVLSIMVLLVVTGSALRSIAKSTHPEVRAAEAVAVTLPMALMPFAAAYYAMSRTIPGSFSVALTRLDALYFMMTTFSTVGYGDITPKTQTARALVLSQMAVDLVLIGLLAKVILGAARRRRASLSDTQPDL